MFAKKLSRILLILIVPLAAVFASANASAWSLSKCGSITGSCDAQLRLDGTTNGATASFTYIPKYTGDNALQKVTVTLVECRMDGVTCHTLKSNTAYNFKNKRISTATGLMVGNHKYKACVSYATAGSPPKIGNFCTSFHTR